jgi:hypothetical protein
MLVSIVRRARRLAHRTDDDETSTASPAETFEQDGPDDDLERYTCPICRELFVEPLYLHDQQHAFCVKCLNKWATRNSRYGYDDDGTLVSCPLCRKYTSVSAARPAFDLVPPGHQVTWGTAGVVRTRVSAPRRPDPPILAPPPRINTFARGWSRFVKALTPSCMFFREEESEEARRYARADTTARSLGLNDGRLIMYGPIHMRDVRNRNGRVYPDRILRREVDAYCQHVNQHRALGELDNPSNTSPSFRSLNLDNVSHQVLDCHWDGYLLMAYVEVLDTPSGIMARDLVRTGFELSCAARGWATLRERDGFVNIQDDYELITFDMIMKSQGQWSISPLMRRYESSPRIDVTQACEAYKREQLASGRGDRSQTRAPDTFQHHFSIRQAAQVAARVIVEQERRRRETRST